MSGLNNTENNYKTNPNLEKDVKKLKDWLEKQPHLPNIDESRLIFFVHNCYNSVEKAKSALDNYLTIRTLCPEMFCYKSHDEFKQAASVAQVFENLVDKDFNKNFQICWCLSKRK